MLQANTESKFGVASFSYETSLENHTNVKNCTIPFVYRPARECYDAVKNLCWDAAFQCPRIWKDYGKCGLLTFLVEELILIKQEKKEGDLQVTLMLFLG